MAREVVRFDEERNSFLSCVRAATATEAEKKIIEAREARAEFEVRPHLTYHNKTSLFSLSSS